MAAASNVTCTPYFSRTIKGWKIRVRLCFGIDPAHYSLANYSTLTLAVIAALNGITNSTWMAGGGWQAEAEQSWALTTNDYDNAEDKAVFALATQDGTIGKISVPNPVDTIFLADKMTVDPANANVTSFIAALGLGGGTTVFVASTSGGAIYNTFLGGLRVRGRTRRKMNIWVRNPELTAPAI